MKRKSILSLILSVTMLFTIVFPMGVFSEELEYLEVEPEIEEVEFEIEDEAAEEETVPFIAKEAVDEDDAEPAPQEEIFADEEILMIEEAPEQEADDEEIFMEIEDEAPFTEGYVVISGGAVVYAAEDGRDEKGSFAGDAIVYAVVTKAAADEGESWLRIVFDTAEAKEANEALLSGYVQFKNVTVLSEEVVEQLTKRLENNYTARGYDDNLLPVVNFVGKEEITDEELIVEDIFEEETVEFSAMDTDTAPVFTLQPQDASGEKGTQVTFTSDAGEASYRWWASKNNGDWFALKGSAWVGYDTNAMTITVSDYTLKCRFKVVATNAAGSTESNIVVVREPSADPAPVFTVQPQDASGEKGTQVTFTSDAGEASYRWWASKNNGDWFELKGSAWAGYDTNTLTITVSDYTLKCRFKAVATNATGSAESNIVVVREPSTDPAPAFALQPQDASGEKGTQVTFTSDAGEASYRWWASKNNGEWFALKGSAWAGYDTNALTITVSDYTLKCRFKVVATNAAGSTESNIVVVREQSADPAPVFTVQPQDASGEKGTQVTFLSDAGEASYRWWASKNNGDWFALKGSAWAGYDTNTLTITVSDYTLKCRFKVVATNAVGSTESNIVVVREQSADPAPVFTLQPQDASGEKGTQVTFTSDAGEASYRWWASKNNGEWFALKGSAWAGYDTNTLTITVSDYTLKCRFKAVATNATGSTESNIVVVREPSADPVPVFTVQPQEASGEKGTQVTFTSDAGEASYQWWASKNNGEWFALKGSAWVGYDTNAMTITVSDYTLKCRFKVVATNATGSTESNIVVVTELPAKKTFTISEVNYEAIDETTCRVTLYTGTSASVVIPEKVTNEGTEYTVTEIGTKAFAQNTALRSIDLPDSITVIRVQAFMGCTSLSEMN